MRFRIGRLRRVWVAAGVGAVVASALGASTAMAAPTFGEIYWANETGSIGAAAIGGGGADEGFITGAVEPEGVAVDGQHIYWANSTAGTIEEGQLSNDPLMATNLLTSLTAPAGVAVDGQHIYWSGLEGNIGRANLDGTDANPDFINDPGAVTAVAVDGEHIYWANENGSIGRANLDGSAVNEKLITGAVAPEAVAVDGGHIYWTNGFPGSIGEADLDGSNVNQNFITAIFDPEGLAVDTQHIYWTNGGDNEIGEADLDGTNVNQSWITGASDPHGIAVSVPVAQVTPAAPPAFAATTVGEASAGQVLTIANTGQQTLSVGNLSVGGQDPDDFFVGANHCMTPLAVGQTCQLDVFFKPLGAGARSATLQIATSDLANSPLQVRLSGTGQAPPPPPPTTTTTTTPVTTMPPPLTTVPGGGQGAMASVPALSGLRVSPKTAHVSGRKTKGGKCVAQTKHNRRAQACTRNAKLTVAFTLTAPATVKLKLTGKLPGRRAGKRCVAQTEHNSRAKRCMRSVTVKGMAARHGKVGANRFTLSRKLAPGRYMLTATPAGGVAKKATYKVTN